MTTDAPSGHMPDEFDRLLGSLDGLPDVVGTKPSTVRTVTPLLGKSQTFIVQTLRQARGEAGHGGDTIFVEYVAGGASVRLVIPPKVADLIARQREALTTKTRSRQAKAAAAERKARGVVPFAAKGKA